MKNPITPFLVLLSFSLSSSAQLICKWDGGGSDGNWATAANWTNDHLPDSTDQVLLDHEFITAAYRVTLPSGVIAVRITSLRITASLAAPIELLLPVTNTLAPSLLADAIQLENGALLRNASGAPNGTAISCTDSLYLFAGGTYMHETETAHATLLNKLSRRETTRTGSFIFNVPGNASYTVSASNRTYGSLQFMSQAAGGTKNYISTGANPLLVRHQLRMDSGVTYSLNLSAPIQVEGDCRIDGHLNLSSGSAIGQLLLKGNWSGTGRISETGTASAQVELRGSGLQTVGFSGQVQQQVGLLLNNPSGMRLLQPLHLPYRLQLQQGVVFSSDTALLSLGPACSLLADSLAAFQYVDGPLCRDLQDSTTGYLFPVGSGKQRWANLKQARGRFTVRYHKSNPLQLAPERDSSIDHVSSLEYWTLQSDSLRSAILELSFDNVNSGGVTDLNSLRVAQLVSGQWTNAGNSGFSGTAGSSGSVRSQPLLLPSGLVQYFSLAALTAGQNPLPLQAIEFQVKEQGGTLFLMVLHLPEGTARLRYEYSTGGDYSIIKESREAGAIRFSPPGPGYYLFRITAILEDGRLVSSRVLPLPWKMEAGNRLRLWPQPASQYIWVDPGERVSGNWQASWYNASGSMLKSETVYRNTSPFRLACSDFIPGTYVLLLTDPQGRKQVCTVIVQ